jgi:signal transduction histidine kinase
MRAYARQLYRIKLAQVQEATALQNRSTDVIRALALAVTLMGALLTAYLWRRASRDIVAPLTTLQQAATALASGHFVEVSHPAAHKTWVIYDLQRDFNLMAAQLQRTNHQLEDQVAERTRELSSSYQRLETLVEELKSLDLLKAEFMAVTSHELLTPLNFIVGFGSSLEDGLMGELAPKQAEAVHKMLLGAERLTRMVRNILDMSQIEFGEVAIWIEPIDYRRLVQSTVAEFQPRLEMKRQHLALTLPDEVPPVLADPDRTRQVLAELLDNAIKFSAEGHEIVVRIRPNADSVSTEVEDQGIGITAEALPDLFKPFFQVDSSKTREAGGLGLGLPNAHHLVHQMGGSITVTSRPGSGSRFQFTLPRADRPEQALVTAEVTA